MKDRSQTPIKIQLLVGAIILPASMMMSAAGQTFKSTSLDQNIVLLKESGSLAALCAKDPEIKECKFAIGEWKPNELERAKLEVPMCFDKCMLDVFGFYKDPDTSREIPAVRTKDFDGSAPSRGFEAIFYPVALSLFRYEGCAGCALIYQYPTKIVAILNSQSYSLPMLARGGYYIPSSLRRAMINSQNSPLTLQATTSEGDFTVNISAIATGEYTKMLRLLQYDKVP